MWTNSCCSHPLAQDGEGEGAVGVKRAAQRRVNIELGKQKVFQDSNKVNVSVAAWILGMILVRFHQFSKYTGVHRIFIEGITKTSYYFSLFAHLLESRPLATFSVRPLKCKSLNNNFFNDFYQNIILYNKEIRILLFQRLIMLLNKLTSVFKFVKDASSSCQPFPIV